MKLGRNEPCHCGSGKKYKKCCLKSDQIEQRKTTKSKTTDTSFQGLVEKLANSIKEKDDSPSDPLMEAKDNFWTDFKGKAFSAKMASVEIMLTETPELCDAEMAFEITNDLYVKLENDDEFEQFLNLIDLIEKHAPEAWHEEQHYMLDYQATTALLLGKLELARSAFLRFSECADRDLDVYYRMISHFAWHGQDELIIEGFSKAKAAVKASEKEFFESTYHDLCKDQAFFDLYRTTSQVDQSQLATTQSHNLPEIKAFLERLATEDIFIEEVFIKLIQHLLLENESSNTLEDYKIDKELYLKQQQQEYDDYDYWDEDEWDDEGEDTEEGTEEISTQNEYSEQEDPAKEHLHHLISNFQHYAYNEEDILMSRIMSGTKHLTRLLLTRGYGEYDDREKPPKFTARKSATSYTNLVTTHPLLFTTQQFKGYMDIYGYRFLFTPYHDLSSFFEIIPVWLRFLNKRNFLDETFNKDILNRLKPQIQEFSKRCASATQDRALHAKVQNWPD